MARFIKGRIETRGKAPGSLMLIGRQNMDHPIVKIMEYDPEKLVEKEIQSICC